MLNKNINILIVDDEESWCSLIKGCLKNHFLVKTADNYENAKSIIEAEDPPFYLMIADISLHGGGLDEEGLKLTALLKEYQIFTNVIILTGYPSKNTIKDSFKRLNVFDYLEKSSKFDVEAFLKIVKAAVDNSAKKREEFVLSKKANVLLAIPFEEIRHKIFDSLANKENIEIESINPLDEDKTRIINLLKDKQHDIVVTLLDPDKYVQETNSFIELIHEYNSNSIILGVGDYNSNQKIIIDAITKKRFEYLFCFNEIDALRRKIQLAARVVEKKYVVASYNNLSDEGYLKLGCEHTLEITIDHKFPRNGHALALPFTLFQEESLRLNSVVILANDVDLLPSYSEDIIIYSSGEIYPARYRITPKTSGVKSIHIDLYRDGRWQGRLKIDKNVVEPKD